MTCNESLPFFLPLFHIYLLLLLILLLLFSVHVETVELEHIQGHL